MKLLLTSVGISNDSIRAALVELLAKPTAACKAICVPTAIYALPGGNADSWLMLHELANIGWQEFGVLELTALPSLIEEHRLPAVEAADIIIGGGGNTGYLSHWLFASGLAAHLPRLLQNTGHRPLSHRRHSPAISTVAPASCHSVRSVV